MDKKHDAKPEAKSEAKPAVQLDSLGQPNPAWELEKKNIEAARERAEKAASDEKV